MFSLPCLASPCQTPPGQTLPNPTWPNLALLIFNFNPCLALPYHTTPHPASPCPAPPCQATFRKRILFRALPCLTTPHPTGPDRTTPRVLFLRINLASTMSIFKRLYIHLDHLMLTEPEALPFNLLRTSITQTGILPCLVSHSKQIPSQSSNISTDGHC